jgi:hypothetical protein
VASKRQRRKRRRRTPGAASAPPADPGAKREGNEALSRADGRGKGPERSRRGKGGKPPAPWGSFPLSELVVLIALVLLVAGFFVAPPRGPVMLGAGLVLGSLAGLELAAREHLAGYRSHTLLLGGAVGMAVLVGLVLLGPDSLSVAISLIAGVLAFAASAWGFALVFRRRSGGPLFKVRG